MNLKKQIDVTGAICVYLNDKKLFITFSTIKSHSISSLLKTFSYGHCKVSVLFICLFYLRNRKNTNINFGGLSPHSNYMLLHKMTKICLANIYSYVYEPFLIYPGSFPRRFMAILLVDICSIKVTGKSALD